MESYVIRIIIAEDTKTGDVVIASDATFRGTEDAVRDYVKRLQAVRDDNGASTIAIEYYVEGHEIGAVTFEHGEFDN